MGNFRDLKVWEKAHHLTLAVYSATSTFPREEAYGLTAQIRRSSSSVAANIAEGCGRGGDTELVRFLHIAMGSATEVEYQLLLAHDLGFVDASRYESLDRDAHEIRRMLASLMQSLKTGD